MPRRGLLIEPDVDAGVQNYRGSCLSKNKKDKTYTDAVNELLKEILTEKGFIER